MLNLKLIKKQAEKELELSQDLKELNHVFDKYLGKKGELSFVLSSLSGLSKEKRAKIGKEINVLKSFLRKEIEKKKIALSKPLISKEKWFDISQPGKKLYLGHLHPLTLAQRNIEDIFQSMGFSIIEGPEVENEWYNFDALNIPKNHPARDLWDTFYLKNGLLLRTHTSPVQMRYMEKNQPPLRIIVPGRVFRHEATDASHESNFYHLEGLMVGKDVSVANFKAIIQEFLKRFFEKKMEIRMRPSYFPFVEPGFEIDIKCLTCGGKGCSVCKKSGWLETLGAGMVHPNVLKNAGFNQKNWQGFAFGLGLDRLTMLKYKINDIRLLYSGDLRFLNQF